MSTDYKIEELEAMIIEKDTEIEELKLEIRDLEERAKRVDKIMKGLLNSK